MFFKKKSLVFEYKIKKYFNNILGNALYIYKKKTFERIINGSTITLKDYSKF